MGKEVEPEFDSRETFVDLCFYTLLLPIEVLIFIACAFQIQQYTLVFFGLLLILNQEALESQRSVIKTQYDCLNAQSCMIRELKTNISLKDTKIEVLEKNKLD